MMDYFGTKLDENLLKRLSYSLASINVVVDDAEQQQIRRSTVRTWIGNVKDAMMDAEDVLEEIYIQNLKSKLEETSEPQISSTDTDKVSDLLDLPVTSFHKNVQSKLQAIVGNLEHLVNMKDTLLLNHNTAVGSTGSQIIPTNLPLEPFIYGRDDDKKLISDWLKFENDKLSIISLVAMGGMGKTTLAQHLFNDPSIQKFFDVLAWVHVSGEFNAFQIMKDTLAEISGSYPNDTNFILLQRKLANELDGKKFFIVLDNMWNDNRMQLENLKIPFKRGAEGSKILVTTRSSEVASGMESDHTHLLQKLEEEHAWELFSKHAFKNQESSRITFGFGNVLEGIAKTIMRKCNGLPLALEAIGGLLRAQSSLQDWNRISESSIWNLPGEREIVPALMLSYQKLPYDLKRCFGYCALFPKGYLFDKDDLILLWTAENFLPRQENGEWYFNNLLSRSFLQPSEKYKNYFIMHDLLHDLAEAVFGNFCLTLGAKKGKNISGRTRHFSFVCDKIGSSKGFETLYKDNKLRTFIPLSMNSYQHRWLAPLTSLELPKLFSKCKLLRVLSLCGYMDMVELPDTVSNLKHLRHLDLSRTGIRNLPDSLCSLLYLQTLKVKDCEHLEELPVNLHKLLNLYYLDFSGTKVTRMPMQIDRLKNLQVLSSFYVSKDSESNVKQLGDLNLHGDLSILELHNITNPLDAALANIESKSRLLKLNLRWNASSTSLQEEREVLENLKPSMYLTALSIEKYGGTSFPSWFRDNSLISVVSLELSSCKNCILLPSLGTMSSLKHLRIIGLSGIVVISTEFYRDVSCSSPSVPFPSLETLIFKDMNAWEEWDSEAVEGVFPRLRKLYIVRCPSLKGKMPKSIKCLVNLKICDCKQLVDSVPSSPIIRELRLINCGELEFNYCSPSLMFLEIRGCCVGGSSVHLIGSALSDCGTNIKVLKIEDSPTVQIPLHGHYNFLVKLGISGSCDSLTTFPLKLFSNLDTLDVYKCVNFETISQENKHFRLTSLSIGECPKFGSFPNGGLSAPRLQHFYLSKLEKLKSLPECMQILLPSLYKLSINDCPQLVSFTARGLPSSIKNLLLIKCSNLLINSLKWAFPTNTSLSYMYIQETDVESFPNQGLIPLSLTTLNITGCQNLKQLDYEGLDHLPSLSSLTLKNCPNIQRLPKEGLPRSISTLQILGDCPLLLERCKKPNGKDLKRIENIQCTVIDDPERDQQS